MNDPEPRDPYAPPTAQPPAPAARRPAPPRGPRPAQTEQSRRAAAAGRLALITGLSGLLLSVFPSVGLLLDALAVGMAIRARQLVRVHGVAAPGAVTGAVLGLIGIVLVSAALALFWRESRAYDQCMSGANTEIAKENCQQDFLDQIRDRFGVRV